LELKLNQERIAEQRKLVQERREQKEADKKREIEE
jgi:hypothetical protein